MFGGGAGQDAGVGQAAQAFKNEVGFDLNVKDLAKHTSYRGRGSLGQFLKSIPEVHRPDPNTVALKRVDKSSAFDDQEVEKEVSLKPLSIQDDWEDEPVAAPGAAPKKRGGRGRSGRRRGGRGGSGERTGGRTVVVGGGGGDSRYPSNVWPVYIYSRRREPGLSRTCYRTGARTSGPGRSLPHSSTAYLLLSSARTGGRVELEAKQ